MTGFLIDEDHIPTKGLKIHNHVILLLFWLYALISKSRDITSHQILGTVLACTLGA